jgi:Raf kinase inhibitor-like YbhB/YbcL family protein
MLRRTIAASVVLLLLPLSVGTAESGAGKAQGGGPQGMGFAVTSPSFQNGGSIPKQFTCDGADVSPELQLAAPPPGTQSLALIADDPDAPVGTWVHWVLFDLPADTKALSEGVAKVDQPPSGGRQGRNDFRKVGYGGPLSASRQTTPIFLSSLCAGRKARFEARSKPAGARSGHARTHPGDRRIDRQVPALATSFPETTVCFRKRSARGRASRDREFS